MKNILKYIIIFLFLLPIGCVGTKKSKQITPIVITPKEEVKTIIRDSVVIRDSVRIIPVERVKDIVPSYDTLNMETSIAKSSSWVDTTTHTLQGVIENKKQTTIQTKVIEKIVERVDTVKIYEPQPYEVIKEVKYIPKVYKYSMFFSLSILAFFLIKIVLTLKKKLTIL